MKRKLFWAFATALIMCCLLAVGVSAEVTVYGDAPARTKIQVSTDDIIEFYDGFTCPSAYVFKDQTRIGDRNAFSTAMDFEYINGKTGKTYTFADVKGFDVPEGFTYIGLYAGLDTKTLKWVSFPASVTSMGNAIFQNATGLENCYFEHSEDSELKTFPSYMFFGCSSLKSFSMPDSITYLPDVGHFSGCKSLTAVHLSENLETWNSGGGGSRNASFDDCYLMYFVNESFGKGETPEKPTVYYFPPKLKVSDSKQDFTKQSTMRECRNLNDVLVFGTELTAITNEYIFQSGPKNTIVFLGDMTNVSVEYWGSTQNIVFANPNDTDASSVTFVKYTRNWGHACSYSFCSTGNKYAANKGSVDDIVASLENGAAIHSTEKTLSTEASCEYPKMLADYCFCGAIMGTPQTEGEALGHDYDYKNGAVDLGVVYSDYFEKGVHSIECARCKKAGGTEAEALFTDKGYSACLFGNTISITRGYVINKEAIDEYMGYVSDFKIGVVITVNQGTEAFVPDFESENVIDVIFDATANDYMDIKVIGVPADKTDALIVLSAYVVDGGNTYFLENGVTARTVTGINYANAPKE